MPDDGWRVERPGAAVVAGDGAAPPLACGRRADEPERRVETEEDLAEQVVWKVIDARRRHPVRSCHLLFPVRAAADARKP